MHSCSDFACSAHGPREWRSFVAAQQPSIAVIWGAHAGAYCTRIMNIRPIPKLQGKDIQTFSVSDFELLDVHNELFTIEEKR